MTLTIACTQTTVTMAPIYTYKGLHYLGRFIGFFLPYPYPLGITSSCVGVRDNYSSKRFKGDMNPALYIKIPDLTSFINCPIHKPPLS